MEIFINGIGTGISGSDNLKTTQNNANLYIGNKGGKSNFLSGSLSNINIYNKTLTDTQILNHYSSSNGSPYIGNVFYSNGLIIMEDKIAKRGIGFTSIESSFIVGASGATSNIMKNISFQGSHLIYENEYKCTIDEYEYNEGKVF